MKKYYWSPEEIMWARKEAEELGFPKDIPIQELVDMVVEETLRLRELVKKIAHNN